jgi:hypothetical protein
MTRLLLDVGMGLEANRKVEETYTTQRFISVISRKYLLSFFCKTANDDVSFRCALRVANACSPSSLRNIFFRISNNIFV